MLQLENSTVLSRTKLLDHVGMHLSQHSITDGDDHHGRPFTPGENLFDVAILDPIREVCIDHAGRYVLTRSEKMLKFGILLICAFKQICLMREFRYVPSRSVFPQMLAEQWLAMKMEVLLCGTSISLLACRID